MSSPVEFTDVNPDAVEFGEFGPAEPDVGRVPDHTETADVPDVPDENLNPWERATAPFRQKSGPKPPRQKKTKTEDGTVPSLPRNFESDLKDVYVTLGSFLTPIDPTCGAAVIQAAPECASKLVALARTNADVRRALHKFVGTSALGAVMAAHAPILMAVVGHHIMPMVANRNRSQTEPDYDVPGSMNGHANYSTPNVHPFPQGGQAN